MNAALIPIIISLVSAEDYGYYAKVVGFGIVIAPLLTLSVENQINFKENKTYVDVVDFVLILTFLMTLILVPLITFIGGINYLLVLFVANSLALMNTYNCERIRYDEIKSLAKKRLSIELANKIGAIVLCFKFPSSMTLIANDFITRYLFLTVWVANKNLIGKIKSLRFDKMTNIDWKYALSVGLPSQVLTSVSSFGLVALFAFNFSGDILGLIAMSLQVANMFTKLISKPISGALLSESKKTGKLDKTFLTTFGIIILLVYVIVNSVFDTVANLTSGLIQESWSEITIIIQGMLFYLFSRTYSSAIASANIFNKNQAIDIIFGVYRVLVVILYPVLINQNNNMDSVLGIFNLLAFGYVVYSLITGVLCGRK